VSLRKNNRSPAGLRGFAPAAPTRCRRGTTPAPSPERRRCPARRHRCASARAGVRAGDRPAAWAQATRVPAPPAAGASASGRRARPRPARSRNLGLGSIARRLRRALGLFGGVQPGAQCVGAILGSVRPTLGGLGPGFRPIRAIALRISPFLCLIRPLPLKIRRPLGPVRPLVLALQGSVHSVMTGRVSGRMFGRTRARLHVRVGGHQDQRPAIVARLGPPVLICVTLRPSRLGTIAPADLGVYRCFGPAKWDRELSRYHDVALQSTDRRMTNLWASRKRELRTRGLMAARRCRAFGLPRIESKKLRSGLRDSLIEFSGALIDGAYPTAGELLIGMV